MVRHFGDHVVAPIACGDRGLQAERVGHRGERRVHRTAAPEDACVQDVEVVELVGPAIGVQRRRGRIRAEPAGTGLMRTPGHQDVAGERADGLVEAVEVESGAARDRECAERRERVDGAGLQRAGIDRRRAGIRAASRQRQRASAFPSSGHACRVGLGSFVPRGKSKECSAG
jgi:hypothetical protein